MWKENITPKQVIEPGRVICWAAKWLGDKEVFFDAEWLTNGLRRLGHEDFLDSLHDMFEDADAVITYNGNKFDEPVIRTEFLKRGWNPPAPHKSIDMYQVVRKQFKLLSNRMDYVGEFLGLGRKVETGGFELWRDVVLHENPQARKKMERYNKRDIILLEKIYKRMLPWIPNHPAHGHHDHGYDHTCPTCGSKKLQRRGTHKTKVSTFQRYQCQSCGAWSRARLADKAAPKPEVVTIC
jgi:predicted RNA-binding Zn-ribbon protein involved in translation (DUF1610 family)